MSVRAAIPADVPAIHSLLLQLSYKVPESKIHQFLMQRPLYHMYVYERDGVVVGMVSWYVTPCFLLDLQRRHIEALVVDAAHRQQGIGKALLDAVEAGERPYLVELLTSERRISTGTHDFYKRMGYSDSAEHGKVYFRKVFE